MAAMGSYKARGIILRRNEYGEADRIYTILTPERKVSAIAKGVRRSKAKLTSHLDLFCEIELMFAEGKNLDVITSARAIQRYDLVEDYERLKLGFLYLEMCDKLTDTEHMQGVYGLLRQSIDVLGDVSNALSELTFKLNLLQELGYSPDLYVDSSEASNLRFDIEHGKITSHNDTSLSLSIEEDSVKLWRLLLVRKVKDVARIKGVEEAATASLPVLDKFIEHQFGKRFKSAEL